MDLIRRNLQLFLFRGIAQPAREAILSHLEWMTRQKEVLNCTCKLETKPDTQTTIVTLELSFHKVQPRIGRP